MELETRYRVEVRSKGEWVLYNWTLTLEFANLFLKEAMELDTYSSVRIIEVEERCKVLEHKTIYTKVGTIKSTLRLYVILDWQDEEDIRVIPNLTFLTHSGAVEFLTKLSKDTDNKYLQVVELKEEL